MLYESVEAFVTSRQTTKDTWEPHTSLAVLQLVKSGMFCIDIGANIGWYTLLFAKLVGPKGLVAAIEVDPGLHKVLVENVREYENRFDIAEVLNYNICLHDHNSFGYVKRGPNAYQLIGTLADDPSGYLIYSTTLDVFVSTYYKDIKDYSCLIKLDVDGHEVPIIRGAKNMITGCKPVIILECAPDFARMAGYNLEEALSFLKSLGYIFNADHGQSHGLNLSVEQIMSGVPKMSSWNIICLPS